MRTTRWLMVIVMVMGAWWLAPGAAWGAEDKPSHAETKAHAQAGGKVNINEAGQTELMKLDGVGAGTAKKIIAWRESHGPFKRPQDLEKVPGVDKKVLDKNHGRIAVK
jgi:competence protein ComEA